MTLQVIGCGRPEWLLAEGKPTETLGLGEVAAQGRRH